MAKSRATGVGQGGKSMQDRELAASVRQKALTDVLAVLTDDPKIKKWSNYKKQMLLNLSKSILPRLNEHTGAEGGAIEITGVNISVRKK